MLKFFPIKMVWTLVGALALTSITFVLTQAAFLSLEASIIASSAAFMVVNTAGLVSFKLRDQREETDDINERSMELARERAYKLEREREYLNQALSSNMKIMPGMLPKDTFNSIEWLRCIVSENYLSLSYKRKALGENSIDWQVELLRLIKQEQDKESFDLRLTRNQSIQAMNSYLNLLEASDNTQYAA